jgi:hypothetical protein
LFSENARELVEPRVVQHPRKFKDLDSQTRRNPSFEPQGVLGAAANPSASFRPKRKAAPASIRGGVDADCWEAIEVSKYPDSGGRSTETAHDFPLITNHDGRGVVELGWVYRDGLRFVAIVIGRELGRFDTIDAATAAVLGAIRKGRARREEGSAD